jgi:RNA recognition motif-containing protein
VYHTSENLHTILSSIGPILTHSFTSETTSIPVNPRTNRPVGYAFVDIATAAEASAAIEALSGKEILQRKVSVQLARKPEPAEAKEGAASGGEGASGAEGRKRTGGRGRGRGRARGRGGRTGRSRTVCEEMVSLLNSHRLFGIDADFGKGPGRSRTYRGPCHRDSSR